MTQEQFDQMMEALREIRDGVCRLGVIEAAKLTDVQARTVAPMMVKAGLL